MKAMVLAAGAGTRLRPITGGTIPKPMVDLGAGPLLEHTVNHLVEAGVGEIVINLHHRGDVIRDHFGTSWRGTPITYVEEDELLGTAGAVKNVEDRFTEPFVLVYGDVLTDIALEPVTAFHEEHDAVLTMVVYREDDNVEDASIVVTEGDRVVTMIEKPSPEQVNNHPDAWTNAGIYVIDPAVIDHLPDGFADFGRDVLPALIEKTGAVYAYPQPPGAYWQEVGTPKRYKQAVRDIAEDRIAFKAGERNE